MQFGIANTSNIPTWTQRTQATFATGIRRISSPGW